ncbi:peptidase M15 [Capybara microvirus Cap1_SP_45]|nr:peptidase M15 [Capybara microvirus Cap1_SP_45]
MDDFLKIEKNLDLQLSSNFNLKEFFSSSNFYESNLDDFCKLDSSTKVIYISNIHFLCVCLQTLRNSLQLPIAITSGWRSPSTNASVAGATFSNHLKGLACDFHVVCKNEHDNRLFFDYGGYSAVSVFLCKIPCAREVIQYVSRDGKVQWIHFAVDPLRKSGTNLKVTYLKW